MSKEYQNCLKHFTTLKSKYQVTQYRHEAAEYLLKKDSQPYSWAKSYLKKL